MKIFYITDTVLPSPYTHSIHFLKQCEGFADNGHTVELLHLKSAETSADSIFKYYGVKENFKLVSFAGYQFKGAKWLYYSRVWGYLKSQDKGLVYTRDKRVAALAVALGYKTLFEVHTPLDGLTSGRRYLWKILYKRSLINANANLLKVVAITNALKNNISKVIPGDKIFVAPDASGFPSTSERLIFKNEPHYILEAGYTGQLYKGKGMEIITELAKRTKKVRYHVVGGIEADVTYWRQQALLLKLDNLLFYGSVAPKDISSYINGFDVCLLPNKNEVKVWHDTIDIGMFTSPLKMFDYMAHGKPIIASDLPVLREILNEGNAILCDPDDPQQWADAINRLIANPQLRENLGKAAFDDLKKNYTWQIRAQRILESIK